MIVGKKVADSKFNRRTISDYNTKPVHRDRAILFLNCTGSLEIARGQLLNCTVVTAWA